MPKYVPIIELGIRGETDVTQVLIEESKNIVRAVRKTCQDVIPDMLFKIGNSFVGMGDYGKSIIDSVENIDEAIDNNQVLLSQIDGIEAVNEAVLERVLDGYEKKKVTSKSIEDFGDKVKSYNNDMLLATEHLNAFHTAVLDAIEKHLKPAKMQFFKDNNVLEQHKTLRDNLQNELKLIQEDGEYLKDCQKKPREPRSTRNSLVHSVDDDDSSDSDDDFEQKQKSRRTQKATRNRSSRKPTANKRRGRDDDDDEEEEEEEEEEEAEEEVDARRTKRDAGASMDRVVSIKEDRENASESEKEKEEEEEEEEDADKESRQQARKHKTFPKRKGPVAAATYDRDRDEGQGEEKRRKKDVVDLT